MICQTRHVRNRPAPKPRGKRRPDPELTMPGVAAALRRLDAENARLTRAIAQCQAEMTRLRGQVEEAVLVHNPLAISLRTEAQPNGQHFITRRSA